MQTIKYNNWKLWLGIAILIFLLVIIFGKCNTDKPIKTVEKIVPDKEVIKQRDAYLDSLQILRSQIEISKKDKAETDRLLTKADRELKGLIAKYNDQKVKLKVDNSQDNVKQQLNNCDSIVQENNQLFGTIGQYQTDMNELIDYYELALKASDSAAIKSNYLLIQSNAAAQQTAANYNDLAKVYNKELKRSKRNKGLNRVLAGALVVVSGILIVK